MLYYLATSLFMATSLPPHAHEGVIGLAVARALALRGREVVLLEAAGAIGTETSSRHSEVIHAGIYYPPGSLKARMCVEGKERLYEYCRTHNVPYKNVTKLIVATSSEQLPELAALRARAAACGVSDLQPLSGAEARGLEPALSERVAGALLSPSTGIMDSHTYMAALLADAEAAGAVLALHTRVAAARVMEPPHTLTLSTAAGGGGGGVPYKVLELHTLDPASALAAPPDASAGSAGWGMPAAAASAAPAGAVSVSRLRARWVVNAAGLHAVALAGRVAGLAAGSVPQLYLAKGNYFSLAGRCPFSRLVYPLPERGLAGLGTHLTLDMAGAGRFGPDVEWLGAAGGQAADPAALDYRVDPARAAAFYPAIRRFFPALPEGALRPAYSGVRPKLVGPGQPAADFLVQGAAGSTGGGGGGGGGDGGSGGGGAVGHGVRGWVNLFGIESPGLTSSLALAEHVVRVLEGEAA
ncbi:hypothetical protein GPECTOR_22g936 [Gonium pectorale]|uniref:L-2-hydroxyglutarate dehydrogenase, mitochondrial n=1 Tax=Gonium pectorale TaxID=33097 RepID=A0A150GHL9_GONPE|nr:hypothetical protein GPECTOR_22g936 [Gonium pectorale]|eukprot:KXZ49342.1 hypothetical protein GPECTOR_22g936 [Gonium pectorale]